MSALESDGKWKTTVINMEESSTDHLAMVARAKKAFTDGRTKPLKFRKQQLKNLQRLLEENQEEIVEALFKDLKKPRHESICLEIVPVLKDIAMCLRHVDEWAKPEKPTKSWMNFLDGVHIYKDPYGVVLVMGAWNYPLQLTLAPVLGAIAAGNCVITKPSELAPHISQLLNDLFPRYLDPDCYPVYQGGIPETTQLLAQRFDYIFYTGSTAVGRIVQAAASKFLTPTTLELGGKSPVYIDASANLETATKRILWGKITNSGQTCIAPDYILCTPGVQEAFVVTAKKVLLKFLGERPQESSDYCRMVNDRNFDRVVGLLRGLKIAVGGQFDPKDKFIEPTIAVDVSRDHPIMHEEIFGPVLPIVTVDSAEEAVRFINEREKSLAIYVFSRSTTVQKLFLEGTTSGGVAINATIMHVATDGLPFGGVGESGMGAYHDKASFDTFTHRKSVLNASSGGIAEKIMENLYPPYTKSKTKMVSFGLKASRKVSFTYLSHVLVFCFGVGLTIGGYFTYKALDKVN